MKKYIFFALALIPCMNALPQYVLTYRNNAILKGDAILSKEIKYVEPGNAGSNQIWDFSRAVFKGSDNTNHVLATPSAKLPGVSEYNLLLNEGEREYYLNLSSSGLEEKGYTSKDLNLVYSDPVLKMKYPFSYGESFTDKWAGTALYQGVTRIELSGDYIVTADAYGTLILPEQTFTNVLRVKSEKNSIEVNPCSSSVVRITRYAWYAAGYRYPLLVVAVTESKTGNQEPVITKTATINVQQPVAPETIAGAGDTQPQPSNDVAVSVYPNPFTDNFSFNYFLRKSTQVKIALYDLTGKVVKMVQPEEVQAEGVHTGELSAAELDMAPGMYYLRFTFENKVVVKKVVKL